MARLGAATPGARDHLAAIAQLRWQLFVNAFRGRKGRQKLVTRIIAGIIVYPIIAVISLAPILGSGFGGYRVIAHSEPLLLATILWILSFYWCFISFSAAIQPALQAGSFDLKQLIRFPVSFPFYLAARLFFSFFSYTTVVGFLSLFALAIGIGIAQPRLFLWAATVLLLYGLTIFFFLRMIFLWLDRWLSQRRTREIFAALLIAFSVSMQFIASTVRSRITGHPLSASRIALASKAIVALLPIAGLLPPNLAAKAVLHMQGAQPLGAIGFWLALVAICSVFLGLYALRLRGEFRGENFSEVPSHHAGPRTQTRTLGWRLFNLPPVIAACVEKELRYLIRGGSALVGYLTPLFFVVIFANRGGPFSKTSDIMFPAALAYVLLALLAALYNIFGQDGNGVHLYLLAPVRMRDVVVAKNLASCLIIAQEVIVATLLVSWFRRISLPVFTATLLWAVFVVFLNLTVGNLRSLYAPRRIDLIKGIRPARSGGRGLLVTVVLFGSMLLSTALIWLCERFGHPWLPAAVFLALAVSSLTAYIIVLNRIDAIVLAQRDTLTEELCRT